jgi:hypothetical protein
MTRLNDVRHDSSSWTKPRNRVLPQVLLTNGKPESSERGRTLKTTHIHKLLNSHVNHMLVSFENIELAATHSK